MAMTEQQVLTDVPGGVARRHGFRRRGKRILRVALVILVGLFVALTLAAVVIDASPVGAPKPARSL